MTVMAEGMAVRTRYFDDFFTAATAAGIRQAVILASGLDARTLPVAVAGRHRGVRGRPATGHRVQDHALWPVSAQNRPPRCAPSAIDLRDDWPAALRANGFDATAPTAWIAEGLLVYLPPEAQDRLFDNITELSAPGSRLATEQVPDMSVFSDEKSQERQERMRSVLNVDMAELVYPGERNHVIDYLTTHGWDVAASGTPELYAANGFTMPDDETGQAMTNIVYLSATFK